MGLSWWEIKGKARILWCRCECLPRVICLPTDMKTREEMRCDTRAHTRQVVAVVALMILWAYGSPGEMQFLVPDVDCKYPTVVYTTQVRVWLSLHALSCYFTSCAIHSVLENFSNLLLLSRLLSFVLCIQTVCVEQWGKIGSDYLEAADNWLRYLSFVWGSPGDYKL